MRWEELTAPEFEKAVQDTGGVCLVPIGVMEKHGDHLPLGTDMMFARYVADKAAEQEPVIVFPDYYLTQIYEAQHQPGAIAIRHELMTGLLESVCDEIARNGMKKIILYNAHGGNFQLLPYFTQCLLEKERDYVVYNAGLGISDDVREKIASLTRTQVDEHAGEQETSAMLIIAPHLVRPAGANRESGARLGRLDHLPDCRTSIQWYANFPNHYAGDGSYARKELGRLQLDSVVAYLVQLVRAVKADTETTRLTQEFYRLRRH